MKKNLFKWLSIFVMTAMCVGFASCGDDDEKISPNSPQGGSQEGTTDMSGGTSDFCVPLSITSETRYSSGFTTRSTILSNPDYDNSSSNGRTQLRSFTKDGERITLTYSGNNIVRTSSNSMIKDYTYTLETSFLHINGRISRWVYGNNEIHTLVYDSNYRMIQDNVAVGSETTNDTYTYDDKYKRTGYQRKRGSNVLTRQTIEYTTIRAKHVPLQYDDWYLYDIGAFHNSIPMYLIKRIIENGEEKSYEYTLDNRGYVVKMVEHKYQNSGTSITTYTINWQSSDSKPSYGYWLLNDVGSPYSRFINQ